MNDYFERIILLGGPFSIFGQAPAPNCGLRLQGFSNTWKEYLLKSTAFQFQRSDRGRW